MNSTFPAPANPPVVSQTRYELPPSGASLAGYVVRRMHKTSLLLPVPGLIRDGRTAEALAQVALYAAGASASYGPAFYQPQLDRVGSVVRESDPATGVVVEVTLETGAAPYRLAYQAQIPGGGLFTGNEEITGTTVGLRGLGMPAPSRFAFSLPGQAYAAELIGVIVSELVPRLLGIWRIRAYGTLDLRDSAGNRGTLSLNRKGEATALVFRPDGTSASRNYSFAGGA